MTTYFLYNIIFVASCSFAYLAEHGNTKLFRIASRLIVFIILWIPASLRYATGTDYFNYVNVFNSNYPMQLVEGGYLYINNMVHILGLSVQWVFVFSSFLTYFPICLILKRKYYFFNILFYIVLLFYFRSYSLVRQAIAVSFCTCAVVYLEEKKYLKFIIWLFLASLFHSSALIILPLLPLWFVKYKKRFLPVFITLFGMVILYNINVLSLLFSILQVLNLKYARYAIYLDETSSKSFYLQGGMWGTTGLGMLIRSSMLFLAIYVSPKILKHDKRKLFMINLSIIYNFVNIVALKHILFNRVRDALMFVPMSISGYAFNAAGRYRKVLMVLIIFINIILFEYSIQRMNRNMVGMSVYPYYSIFSK
jgi:hypothetical protein